MLSFDEALAKTLAPVRPLPVETVELAAAAGRVLAEDLVSALPLPAFDFSERDGYAVAAAPATAFQGEPPFRLTVSAEHPAGSPQRPLLAGTAARIFTGGPLPEGADAVVMQEDADAADGEVALRARPAVGAWVRRRGEDLRAGGLAVASGTRLSPAALSLVAMLGRGEVAVVRRPKVVVVPNGDELRPPGAVLASGEIYEANAEPLAALARQAGAEAETRPPVKDRPELLRAALAEALLHADLLVTVGGMSVGDRDLVRPALAELGVALEFWRVAIKPGKPMAVGRRGGQWILGLPGNPASALVTFGLFGMPLLRALQGDARPRPPIWPARLARSAALGPEREQFLRVALELRDGAVWATPVPQQAAGAAVGLAASDGLARLPRGPGELSVGAAVGVLRWSDL